MISEPSPDNSQRRPNVQDKFQENKHPLKLMNEGNHFFNLWAEFLFLFNVKFQRSFHFLQKSMKGNKIRII